ncbi:MAG TPA: LuxR C-terminal-related transcriptional regulator [Solirubrobacteraceae bacterium]|nr:LuxR C-terminal-related transcriptional regulator [Solirubrobacteraceae bacterium]
MAGPRPDPRLWSRALKEQLLRASTSGGADIAEAIAELYDQAGELRASLTDHAPRDPDVAADLCARLIEMTEVRHELREEVIAERFATLTRIQQALGRLRMLDSATELIDAAPKELCESCDFDRGLISRVHGSTWLPQQLYVAERQDGEELESLRSYLDGLAIPLSSALLETELVRRKAPALVREPMSDPRVFHPLMREAASRAYVAAPIMPTGRVIGLLHGDIQGERRPLTTADRDNIFTFAEGFGLIYERAVLLDRLRAQRDRVRETFDATGTLLDELCAAEVRLHRQEREAAAVSETAGRMFNTARETRLTALFTTRERDVLALMVEGATNGQIAERLVIAEGTVKSHVKHILRKLRASNRAEAISLCLQLRNDPQAS